ncbi:SurA N-terminal domain-containing protein [Myxococcota bacterium]|nr:SurA N-terminal domain-containing protein [Myxococcota bacterium]
MLESMRRGQRWLALLAVSVIGVVFVFYLGTGGGLGPATPSGNAIVQLDEVRLTQNDLGRERSAMEERLRAELGDAYDQLGADKYLDGQALMRLVNQLVLATAAQDMGLQVTTDEIRRVVQSSPGFIDEEGRFVPEAFDRFAEDQYGSQRAFMEVFTRDLLGQKLIQLLVGQTALSDAELDLAIRYELEDVQIAYVAFDETQLSADESISDADAETYAAAHEAELEKLFGEREAELSLPDRVHARHVLVPVVSDAPDADVAAAREKAQRARDRILAGEDFAAVATEISGDTATAQQGGDLGTFARGVNDPAFDDAAFALEAGGLSEVVRSVHGFHVIRVDEKLPAEKATFASHRLALAREGAARERATKQAEEKSQALAASVREGKSLEDAAREAGLTLERPPALKRREDGFVPGLGAADEVLSAAFALEPGQSSPEIFDLADKKVLIQVLERTRIADDQLASERASRREQALAQKQSETVQTWVDDYRTRLERSGRLLINSELALGS